MLERDTPGAVWLSVVPCKADAPVTRRVAVRGAAGPGGEHAGGHPGCPGVARRRDRGWRGAGACMRLSSELLVGSCCLFRTTQSLTAFTAKQPWWHAQTAGRQSVTLCTPYGA